MNIWKSYTWSAELYEGRSSHLCTELLQLQKKKQERKFRLVRNSNPFCDTGAPLYQLSYQPNWEQVVELASYKPVKGWWWSYEYMKIMRELQSGDLYEGRSLQLRKENFSGFKTKLLTLQLLSSLLIEFACSLFLTLVVSWKCPFGLVGLICLTCSLKNAFSIAIREERNSLSHSPESYNVITKSLIAFTASVACKGGRGVGSVTNISSWHHGRNFWDSPTTVVLLFNSMLRLNCDCNTDNIITLGTIYVRSA